MGLLDDAIREHLDLKRRRGADPTEVERAEREALGPVRRGPELTDDEAVAPEPAGAAEAAEYVPPESEEWEPFHEDPELRESEEPDELAPYEHPRAPDGDPLMDDESLMEDEPLSGEPSGPVSAEPSDLAPVPEAEEPLPPPHPADPPPAEPNERLTHVDQETEEYDMESEEEADDDVLETTPEFLQDAPEHDRLWFEQRPPRDFDFDG